MMALIDMKALARSNMYFSYTIDLTTSFSDAGFGCMLRSAQMMASTCLRKIIIAEDELWLQYFLLQNEEKLYETLVNNENYCKLLSSFNFDSPLGIGSFLHGVQDRSWYGPRTSAMMIAKAINNDESYPDILVHVALDRMVISDEILRKTKKGGATILIVTCRLGEETIPVGPLATCISKWMQDKHCAGMLCGTGGRGMYAFTADGDVVYCLDPHTLRFETPLLFEVTGLLPNRQQFSQIHSSEHTEELNVANLDPELAVSFVFQDQDSLEAWLLRHVSESAATQDEDMFAVLETAPSYAALGEQKILDDDEGFLVL